MAAEARQLQQQLVAVEAQVCSRSAAVEGSDACFLMGELEAPLVLKEHSAAEERNGL